MPDQFDASVMYESALVQDVPHDVLEAEAEEPLVYEIDPAIIAQIRDPRTQPRHVRTLVTRILHTAHRLRDYPVEISEITSEALIRDDISEEDIIWIVRALNYYIAPSVNAGERQNRREMDYLRIAEQVVSNDDMPSEALDSLSDALNPYIDYLVSTGNSAEWARHIQREMFAHPNLSGHTINRVLGPLLVQFSRENNSHIGASAEVDARLYRLDIAGRLLSHDNCPLDLLKEGCYCPIAVIRKHAESNQNCPEEARIVSALLEYKGD